MKSNTFSGMQGYLKLGFFSLLLSTTLAACSGGGAAAKDGKTVISGEMTACKVDSIRLYEVQGARIQQIAATVVDGKANKFTLEVKLPHAGFYMIGSQPMNAINLLLDASGEYTLKGDCGNAKSLVLENSEANTAYTALQDRVNNHNSQLQGLYQNLQLFGATDPSQVGRIQNDIANLNKRHFAYLDSIETKGGVLGKVSKMYNFKPYDPATGKYPNELEYFRLTFFENLDLNDAELATMPQVFDKARAYSATLSSQNLSKDVLKSSFDALLAKSKPNSIGHEGLLRGVVAGLEQTKNELFVEYGKMFVGQYPQDQQYAAYLNNQIGQMQAMATGAEAPDFEVPTPQGKNMKLSDFRGKYVLVDFWASWCRPCRAENPNVVKAYNKYHPKGFEILGVSLDQEKGKWENAIAQDGLIWNHVSDLKGWSSQPAQVYGVQSIPATVLVDPDGKIIARNLRGVALEDKLKEIYGI
jgi:peroxiredoxin